MDFVLAELADYAALLDPATGAEMSTVDGVYQSDSLVPESLRQELLAGAAAVLAAQEAPDYHPGSHGQVLDIVHPSLYPLVLGQTRAFSEAEATLPGGAPRPWSAFVGGGGETVPSPPPPPPRPAFSWGRDPHTVSAHYQWLPAEVDVAADGGSATFVSYINNLHPIDHAPLYATLGHLFARFVPLFDRVLGTLRAPVPPRVTDVDPYGWWGDTAYDEHEAHEPKQPAVPAYTGLGVQPPAETLAGRRVQVIVKLADIVLTPERPEFPGGVWHIVRGRAVWRQRQGRACAEGGGC